VQLGRRLEKALNRAKRLNSTPVTVLVEVEMDVPGMGLVSRNSVALNVATSETIPFAKTSGGVEKTAGAVMFF